MHLAPPELSLLLAVLLCSGVGCINAQDAAVTPDDAPPDPSAAQQHQEAFLGKDAAPEFSNLSPEEAKPKLVELTSRLDTNHDGAVSVAEMENWLSDLADKERRRLAQKRFLALKEASGSENKLAPLTFEEYELAIQKEVSDGPDDAAVDAGNATRSAGIGSHHAALIERSRRRWVAADVNQDGALTAEELADFLRPEESPRMRDVVVQESLGNTDTNRDGRIDLGEYLRELYPDYDRDRRDGKKLPDWVAKEEMHFRERLDLDKNGSLDKDEIYKFAVPATASHAKSETQYLFDEADEDKNKFLSNEEVLKHWNIFVGHMATNYGAFEQPRHGHDEL